MNDSTWKWVTLGTLFHIGAGKTMSAAAREGKERVPFLRTSNVFWDRIDLSNLDEMSIPARELVGKRVEPGDLLICEGGEIGRAAVWEGGVDVISFQNHLHRLRPKRGDVVPHFYVYFLQSAFTQLGIFEGAGNRTTIPNLSSGRLAALEVPHPSEEEQHAIVSALRAMRASSTAHERLEKTATELKRSVMSALFTRGLRGEDAKETLVGVMPKSWEPRPLTALVTITSGGTPRKSVQHYWEGSIPWVSGKDLKRPELDDAQDHVTEEAVAAGSRLAPANAVLLLVRGMGLAKDLPVATISRPMAFNQDVKALVSRGEYSGRFLRAAIYAGKDRLLDQIVSSAHGTMTLNLHDVENMMIACPGDPLEAEEIVKVLDTIESKIALHRRSEAVATELFRSLLFKLMTHEAAVTDLDISAAQSILGDAA